MEVHILRFAKNLMILVGFWCQDVFSNTIKQQIYQIFSYIIQGYYSTVSFMVLLELGNSFTSNDVEKLTDNGIIFSVTFILAVKVAIFQSSKFRHLINEIIEEEHNILIDVYEDIKDEHEIYLKYVNYICKLSIAIMVAVGSTSSYLVLKTIIYGMTIKEPDVGKPMIFFAKLPFDQNQHYRATLVVQIIFVLASTVYYCLTQILYLSISTFVNSKLRILQYRFRNFDKYKKRFDSLNDGDVMKKLIGFHNSILRFVKEFNDAIKYVLLMEFVFGSMNIAMVTFRLISSQVASEFVLSVGYVALLIAQLFLTAFHADAVRDESVAVSDAVYDMNWYEKSLQVQEMALIVIIRSQKPSSLTIGHFNPLTTQTIASVLNAAYSYITIMKRN